MVLGGGFIFAGRVVSNEQKEGGIQNLKPGQKAIGGGDSQKALPGGAEEGPAEEAPPPKVSNVPPMTLEIGFGLVPLVDKEQGGDLVQRIGMIRDQIREEFGFQMPPVSVQDNIELDTNEYRILLRGLERARGVVYAGSELAIDAGEAMGAVEGIKVVEPAFGYDAYWISPTKSNSAEAKGYTVVNAQTVIATHLTKIVREHAAELLRRQEVSEMLDALKQTNEAVVEELVPELLGLGVVHRVLQHLLAEQVPIHDLPSILETLTDYAHQSKDPTVLGEFCRQSLAGHLIAGCVDSAGTLHAITLSPELESAFQKSVTPGNGVGSMTMAPAHAAAACHAIQDAFEQFTMQVEAGPVLLTSPLIRFHLRQLLARRTPELNVLSYGEVLDDVPLSVLGAVEAPPDMEMAVA